jgi:hypothetical protein
VVDPARNGSGAPRLRELVDAYRGILARYEEIVDLSREERRLLAEREPIGGVNTILHEKKRLLAEIRAEEERVTGAREWWKKVRRSLPPRDGQDLLSLLDAISRCVETSLALEGECRDLLTRTTAWGAPPVAPGHVATRAAGVNAAAAYARAAGGDR